jgi:hypothetical protein
MRKISLDVDALKVESFETAERGAEERGTVRANFTRYYEVTCRATYCGAQCPSGPHPCEGSYAWTDGMAACLCNDTTIE